MEPWISGDKMVELTGARRPADQARVLNKHGIFYIHRLDNVILTTEYHINHPFQASKSNEDEPDMSALDD